MTKQDYRLTLIAACPKTIPFVTTEVPVNVYIRITEERI